MVAVVAARAVYWMALTLKELKQKSDTGQLEEQAEGGSLEVGIGIFRPMDLGPTATWLKDEVRVSLISVPYLCMSYVYVVYGCFTYVYVP